MTIQQLRYLAEIAQWHSLSKAAKNLFVSQPSISKAIKDLERELGITIFERASHGVRLTPDGMELLYYAKQLLEQADSIARRFVDSPDETDYQIGISAQHYVFTVGAFIELLNNLGEGKGQIRFREERTSEVIEDISSARSQLGVIFVSNANERFMNRLLAQRGIEFHPLKTVLPHVFLGRKHPLAGEKRLNLKQLAPYPCISYEQGTDSVNFSEEIYAIDGKKKISVTDRGTMVNVISRSLCYNIGTGCLLEGVMDESLTSVPLDCGETIRIGWINKSSMPLPPILVRYVELLQEVIRRCHYGET